MSNAPSLEDIRIVSCVEEIVLRDRTPESEISSAGSSLTRKDSTEEGDKEFGDGDGERGRGMARDIFSGRTIFLDALERHDDDLLNPHGQQDFMDPYGDDDKAVEIHRYDTMKSVYVDALDDDQPIPLNETMEISVVAEIHDGLPRPLKTPYTELVSGHGG